VGGHPVVGAGLARRGAGGGGVVAVLGDRHRAVGGDFAFALFVGVELPADRAARRSPEQAADRGLVLEGRPHGGRGGFLRGLQFRGGLVDPDRLGRAAAGGFGVGSITAVLRDPPVVAGGGRDLRSFGDRGAASGQGRGDRA